MAQSDNLGMVKTELFKLHVHLGHAPAPQIIAMLTLSKRTFSEKVIEDMIRECVCTSSVASNFKAVANTHTSPFPGYCVFIDVIYPEPMSGHSLPFLTVVGAFSRFAICPALRNLKPEHLIGVCEKRWVSFLRTPRFLVKDGGPGTAAGCWGQFAIIHNIAMVVNPTNAPCQMGRIERHVGILKIGLGRIQKSDPSLSLEEAVRKTCIAENHCLLMNSGVSPAQLVFG